MTEHLLGSEERPLRVAVVGSGPSGFYAVQALFKKRKVDGLAVSVDVFDRLPTPFGLVRGGVAPDHQKIKNVTKAYERIAGEEGFRFFGNVKLGRDIQVEDLVAHYDQIVYATGCESDRKMGIPGEDLEGVFSATEFVGWYNGHPDFRDRDFDLPNAKHVVIVGIGNVAIDVARVLARQPAELAETDIADYAIKALEGSSVKEVFLVGRRGPAQSKFAPKEIRELASLPDADLVIQQEQMALDELSAKWVEEKGDRDTKKNLDFLTAQAAEGAGEKKRKINLLFLASPVELIGEDGRLTKVRFEKNELYADDRGTPRSRGAGEFWEEDIDLVFKAVGYRGLPIPGVPFHKAWGIFPNIDGRLTEYETDVVVPDQYVVGWAKRGPSGLIGTNNPCSVKTVDAMLEDISGRTTEVDAEKEPQAVVDLLDEKGIDYITWEDWTRLNQSEIERGKAAGKIRQKYTTVEEMMSAIKELRK